MFASLNSPPDESAVADMTTASGQTSAIFFYFPVSFKNLISSSFHNAASV